MVMKNLGGSPRGAGGITGGAGRNVSKVNKNGAAAPATPSTKKTAKKKKMTPEEGIAADLNAFLNFNAGR